MLIATIPDSELVEAKEIETEEELKEFLKI